MFQTKFMEQIKPHIFLSVTLFPKSPLLRDNVGKFAGTDRSQVKYNTTHAHCMLGNQGYRHTQSI